jgi:hypothetical protein
MHEGLQLLWRGFRSDRAQKSADSSAGCGTRGRASDGRQKPSSNRGSSWRRTRSTAYGLKDSVFGYLSQFWKFVLNRTGRIGVKRLRELWVASEPLKKAPREFECAIVVGL